MSNMFGAPQFVGDCREIGTSAAGWGIILSLVRQAQVVAGQKGCATYIYIYMGMSQNLQCQIWEFGGINFWMSIYQLFGIQQGTRVLTHSHIISYIYHVVLVKCMTDRAAFPPPSWQKNSWFFPKFPAWNFTDLSLRNSPCCAPCRCVPHGAPRGLSPSARRRGRPGAGRRWPASSSLTPWRPRRGRGRRGGWCGGWKDLEPKDQDLTAIWAFLDKLPMINMIWIWYKYDKILFYHLNHLSWYLLRLLLSWSIINDSAWLFLLLSLLNYLPSGLTWLWKTVHLQMIGEDG